MNLRPEQWRGREAVPLDGCRAAGRATRAAGTSADATRRLVRGAAGSGLETPHVAVVRRRGGRGRALVGVGVPAGRGRGPVLVVVAGELAPAPDERVARLRDRDVTIGRSVGTRGHVTLLHVPVRV